MFNRVLKRAIDVVGATCALIVLSPVFVAIGVWIWADSGFPVFFRQDRLGRNGRVFSMYKFRSMIVGAEQQEEGLFTYDGDRRITSPGRFIRALSLDELPQFINVLRGEMSLVGPRPAVTYELGNYADFDERLKRRFSLKPGLTGQAQISGRNALNWDQKIEHDLRYIDRFERYGVVEDIRIMAVTPWVVLSMRDTNETPSDQAKRD